MSEPSVARAERASERRSNLLRQTACDLAPHPRQEAIPLAQRTKTTDLFPRKHNATSRKLAACLHNVRNLYSFNGFNCSRNKSDDAGSGAGGNPDGNMKLTRMKTAKQIRKQANTAGIGDLSRRA